MSRAFACESGLRGAGLRELRAEVAQLLRIDADIVGAEEEPGLAAILLDLGLGLADPLPKPSILVPSQPEALRAMSFFAASCMAR